MATLTSTKIKNTYDALLKSIDNDAIGTTAKQITDGLGNVTPLYISTTQVGIGVTPEAGLNLHVFGDAKIGSNLTVIGNLVVEGSTTTVGTDTLTVKDPLIVLANNNTSTDAVDIGFYGKYTPSGTTLYSGLFREALTGKYRLFKGLEVEPTTTVNTSGTGYAVASLVANLEGNVTGGTISGTTGTFSGDVTADAFYLNGMTAGSGALYWTSDRVTLANYNSSGILRFETGGGTNALTLDDSQNATFAGSVSANSFSGNLTGNVTGDVTGNVTGDLTGNVTATSVLADGVTATTQSDGDNSTKVATTAYVDTAIEGHDTLAEVLAGGNTSGGTSMIISNGDDLTVNTSTLKVDSTNSQVGINNASPSGFTGQYSKDLIIGDGTGDRGITIYSSSSAYGSLFFKDAEGSSTGNGGFIAYNHFVDGMEFGIGNAGLGAGSLSIGSTSIFMKKKLIVDATYSTTNTLTVDPSNARVGIFNDSPSYRLDVAGDARFTGQTIISSDLTVDTDTLFVDASEDSVGIGLTNPSDYSADELVISVPDDSGMTLVSGTTDTAFYVDKSTTIDDTLTVNGNSTFAENVGIGGTLANKKLYVLGDTTNYQILAEQPSGYAGLSIKSTTVAQTWSWLANDNGSNSDLLLYGGAAAGTKLTIDSSGNVGIGTDSPNVRTEIKASVNGNPVTSGQTQTNGALRVRGSATNVLDIGQQSAAPYGMWMQVSEATSLGVNYPLLLNPNGGNVGIGTTSPSDKLSVYTTTDYGNNSEYANATIGLGNQTYPVSIRSYRYGGSYLNGLDFYYNDGTQKLGMRINSSGNVGIGTDSPNNKLEISDTGVGTGSTHLKISRGADATAVQRIAGIKMGNTASNDGSNWIIQADSSSGYFDSANLDFIHNAAGTANTKMRITSGGNIDINSHTGATIGYGVRIAKQSGYSQIYMEADTTTSRILQRFYNPTGNVGNISIVAYNTTYSTSSSDERLKKNITNWDENILDKFKDIKPKEFHFHNQDDSEGKIKGYIAQNEVDKFPEAYPLLYNEEVGEDRHMFNPSGMVVYLMKAIQELKAEVDKLKQECKCKN